MDANQSVDELRDGVVVYSFRPSLMGAPQEFAVAPESLRWSVGSRSGCIPYTAIRRVHLSYRPLSLQMYRFQIEIWSEGAPKITVASTSWRSMVVQERQDFAYNAFIRALHARIAAGGARSVLRAGTAAIGYWPGLAMFCGMLVLLPWILAKTARADAFWGTVLVVLMIGVFLWQIGAFFWRNRPRAYDATALPPAVLPRG